MKRVKHVYHTTARLEFTGKEVNMFVNCGVKHYDFTCNRVCGVGGFVYGMTNRFDDPVIDQKLTTIAGRTVQLIANDDLLETIDVELDFTEIDLLAKITEQPGDGVPQCERLAMHNALRDELRALNVETERLNPN